MNNAEINLKIAKIEHPTRDSACITGECGVDVTGFGTKDYCNNWADIGPIIERENMFLAPVSNGVTDSWLAESMDCFYKVTAETPTKAAALCYLKMKGE